MCFEPARRGEPPKVVGDIFRALIPIVAEKPDIKHVALPIVAAGDQGYGVATMMAPLLDAALHWLESGLPLESIRIVAFSDAQAQAAHDCFEQERRRYETDSTRPPPAPDSEYDVLFSYARENTLERETMEQHLRHVRPNLRVFVDANEIDIGSAWQPAIFGAIDRSHKDVALLSPDYLISEVCKEEFNLAWARARKTKTNLLFPVYLYTTALPTFMEYRQYADCREGDGAKIAVASNKLLATLRMD